MAEDNEHARRYTNVFKSLQYKTLIALWSPYSSWPGPEVALGDVGYLRPDGGFFSIFNLFLDHERNVLQGHAPPLNFKAFRESCIFPLTLDEDYTIHSQSIRRGERREVPFGQMIFTKPPDQSSSGSETSVSHFLSFFKINSAQATTGNPSYLPKRRGLRKRLILTSWWGGRRAHGGSTRRYQYQANA